MLIGTCEITIHIPYSQSLKDKRRVIKMLKDKIHHRFNVSIAEVGKNESWQIAELGIVTVSNDSKHIDQSLNAVIRFIQEQNHGDYILQGHQFKIISPPCE